MCAPFHPRVQTAGRAQLLTRQLVFHKPVKSLTKFCPIKPLASAHLFTCFILGIWNCQHQGTGSSQSWPGLSTLLWSTWANLAWNASTPAAMNTYPDSWEGLAHSKPPFHSDGSFSRARHLPAEDAKVSKITQRSHLSVQKRDNNRGRIFRPAVSPASISEWLFLDQSNKQKDSTLLFLGGRMKGRRDRTGGVGNLQSLEQRL